MRSSIDTDCESWSETLAARWFRANIGLVNKFSSIFGGIKLWRKCRKDFEILCKTLGLNGISLIDDASAEVAKMVLRKRLAQHNSNRFRLLRLAYKFDLL